ncbi:MULTISPECIES: peptidoglycan-binding domain-containing protein [unclassified Streptomyces]|uniref:peptidoglycan-binding domain-containing protein n=1 Tax=unclassified Streptomyces TaxID=2593676 RepID=UPI003406C6B3
MSLPDPETSAASSPDPTGAAPPPPPLRRRPLPGPDAEPARQPYDDGLGLGLPDPEIHERPGDHPEPARRRRAAGLLLAGAGAVAALTAATVFAVGLLSSATDGPTRDRALPGDPASAYADPTKPAPPSAKASGSPTHSPSAPPSPTSSSSTAVRSAPRSPSSPPPSTARATGSVEPRTPSSSPSSRRAPDSTLRQGDRGPQVEELQGRLAQLYLYVGERDGSYTSEVTAAVLRYQWARGLRDDTPGAYGRQTRRSLEAETTEP